MYQVGESVEEFDNEHEKENDECQAGAYQIP